MLQYIKYVLYYYLCMINNYYKGNEMQNAYANLEERLEFINRALKSTQFSPEEIQDLIWERDCCKREIEIRNDREYIERIAKQKADAMQEEINDKLIIRRWK